MLHGFFSNTLSCLFRFSAISSQNSAELTGRSDTKTMAKMRIIKGKFWSIMTSLQALSDLLHASRNYSQIWGNVENMCFCRAAETHCTSDVSSYLFLKERTESAHICVNTFFDWS